MFVATLAELVPYAMTALVWLVVLAGLLGGRFAAGRRKMEGARFRVADRTKRRRTA